MLLSWRNATRLALMRLLVRVAQHLMAELTEAQQIRQDILSIDTEDLDERPYFAPRWGPVDPQTGRRTGRWFVVRELTGDQRAMVMDKMVVRDPKTRQPTTNLKALYTLAVILGLRVALMGPGDDSTNPNPQHKGLIRGGEQVFNLTDQEVVFKRSGATLEEIGQIVMKMSGLDEDAVEEAKKNSIGATPTPTIVESTSSILSLPSTSDSPTPTA